MTATDEDKDDARFRNYRAICGAASKLELEIVSPFAAKTAGPDGI
jgi:hypothetical protein